MSSDTICAIATAQGGAIGLIRVSGPDAVSITDSIFTPLGKGATPLSHRQPYTLTFGHITNEKGDVVDEVLVSLFRAPHSYTGEDSTEISCHGSPYILQEVMRLLLAAGCRTASPGEFTQRAFLSGKMDLSQAEAVADLIASTSAASHRLAMSQMRGSFSRKLSSLREQLLHLTSLMELELDFSDHEELEFADRSELIRLTDEVERTVTSLADSFSLGNAVKNGIPVAIIGETNVGKSTLLNALVGEDKAIVSDIHGTTRDIIEDTVSIGGVTFRFIDTAGIRQTSDTIESMGIERSFRAMDKAQIVIIMLDMTQPAEVSQRFLDEVSQHLEGKQVIVAMNKCDSALSHKGLPYPYKVITISAKYGINISELQKALVNLTALPDLTSADVVVTNVRHYEALTRAQESIRRVRQGLDEGIPADLVSQDLRECSYYLGSIVGEVTTDEVLGNIFSHFCIGK